MPCAANAVKVDRFETAPGHPHIHQQTGAHSCAAESPMRTNQRKMGEGWIGSGGASGTRTPELRITQIHPTRVTHIPPTAPLSKTKDARAKLGDLSGTGEKGVVAGTVVPTSYPC